MSQEREFPINNLINAAEVHNKFYGKNRELFEWMKASEEKSNHQQRVCCRGLKHGHFFEASYDKSIDMYINYTSGTSSNRIPVDLIEWLKPIKPESITNSSIEQMAEEKDLIIAGIAEGAEQWKAEYDNCRAILQELVSLKEIKDRLELVQQKDQNHKFINEYAEYVVGKKKAWKSANNFLEKYTHQ